LRKWRTAAVPSSPASYMDMALIVDLSLEGG
jgi:hypothetical protein